MQQQPSIKSVSPLPTRAFRVGASAFYREHRGAVIAGGIAVVAIAAIAIGWHYKSPSHPTRPPSSHAAIAPVAVTHSTPHAASASTPKPASTATPSAYAQSQPYMKAGIGFYNAGDYKQAVDSFKDAEDQDEKNADAYWWLSRAYLKLDKTHKECKQLSGYLELAPHGEHAKDAKAEQKKQDC